MTLRLAIVATAVAVAAVHGLGSREEDDSASSCAAEGVCDEPEEAPRGNALLQMKRSSGPAVQDLRERVEAAPATELADTTKFQEEATAAASAAMAGELRNKTSVALVELVVGHAVASGAKLKQQVADRVRFVADDADYMLVMCLATVLIIIIVALWLVSRSRQSQRLSKPLLVSGVDIGWRTMQKAPGYSEQWAGNQRQHLQPLSFKPAPTIDMLTSSQLHDAS
eukprot:TRINITY_DN124812_c0_g1_i1.p1 TRINITY_DN124812_c0_g1~~TRINITY_DN124812_c0_g1_i1.p1  ORF type:complete len:225 (+),score=47.84 TRINITY_DN124812_c0_g1_i1:120-794(+)